MRGEFRLLAPQPIGHVARLAARRIAKSGGRDASSPFPTSSTQASSSVIARRRMPPCVSQSPMNFATATEKTA
jgi:hypothetical protein